MKLKRDSVLGGRYNIRALLGEGGMGVVYRALDIQLRRQVAIKTIQGDKACDREFLKRFEREARAVSQIEHPHIVRLFDFVAAAEDQPPYMVMELLAGKDLGSVIRQDGPLDITRAVTRVLEASIAVGECHGYGLLHRDLKPNNIFLHVYNQVETAKVLDFGCVAHEERGDAEREDTDLTRKGTLLGSPYYMSPEQIHGFPATAKSDQYSLAVVLYTAIAGRKPFEIERDRELAEFELAKAISRGECARLEKVRPEVPPGLAEAIHRAMSVDSEQRFRSVHAFGAALRPFALQQARLTWEAHFTNSAPVRREPQLSSAIAPADGPIARLAPGGGRPIVERTFTQPESSHPTEATVVAKPEVTISIGPDELKAALGEPTRLGAQRLADAGSGSFSLDIDESSAVPGKPAGREPSAESSETDRRWRNRPAVLMAAALGLVAGTGVISLALRHERHAAPVTGQPPPEFFNRGIERPPNEGGREVNIPPAEISAPTSPPASSVDEMAAAPAPTRTPQVSPTLRSGSSDHQARRRHQREMLDAHGIPIPTN